LPKIHLIAKNRLTQYMGPASAYMAVLKSIEDDVKELLRTHPHLFTFSEVSSGFVEIRDFQTTGVVAFAKGLPFHAVSVGKQNINGHRVQVQAAYLDNAKASIQTLATSL
jgi:hypothetical protein